MDGVKRTGAGCVAERGRAVVAGEDPAYAPVLVESLRRDHSPEAKAAEPDGVSAAVAGEDPACAPVLVESLRRDHSPEAKAAEPDGGSAADVIMIGNQLSGDVQLMGQYIGQLGQLIRSMQRRLDEMEARQDKVTVSHEDVKRLNARIRARAGEIADRYVLDAESVKVIRAAIKKDVLKRCGVTDLHDIRASCLEGAESQINAWSNIRLIMDRRTGK